MKDPTWRRCVLNADSRDIIKRIPDNSIDFILTDPPYNLAKHSTGDILLPGRSAINNNLAEWDLVDFNPEEWAEEFIRILKPTGNLFIFTSYNQIGRWYDCLDHRFDSTNFMVWHKSDPTPKIYKAGFLNSCELIFTCWNKKHTWNFSSQSEMHNFIECGVCRAPERLTTPKHPTQKPVSILKKMIEIATNKDDIVFDPFMGVGSTGVAAMELGRKFIGVELEKKYYMASIQRIATVLSGECDFSFSPLDKMYQTPSQNQPMKVQDDQIEKMVLVNHAKPESLQLMMGKGICYLRAGESNGSLEVTPGFERMQYVCLHSNGDNVHIFRLKKKGCFNIWTKETLEAHGFHPSHAPYYIVLPFDNKKEIEFKKLPQLRQRLNTYRAKIYPLSDFIGIK